MTDLGIVDVLHTMTDSQLLAWREALGSLRDNPQVSIPVAIVMGAMTLENPGQIRRATYLGGGPAKGVARVRLAYNDSAVLIAFDRIWPIAELEAAEAEGHRRRRQRAEQLGLPESAQQRVEAP